MKSMKRIKKSSLAFIAFCLVGAILSFTVFSGWASDPKHATKTIAGLDEKKETVMQLTAAATVTSAAITVLPGDTCTPIANKLADLSGYFLIVLTALYLEKYLLTITGVVAFRFLIPFGLLLLAWYFVRENRGVKQLALKMLGFGIAVYMIIPASVWVSDRIDDTYHASIEQTMEDAKNVVIEVEAASDKEDNGEESAEKSENKDSKSGGASARGDNSSQSEESSEKSGSLWDKLVGGAEDLGDKVTDTVGDITETITTSTVDVKEKVKNVLNRFIEALAVLIVTSCVIPILVLIFFLWLIKAFVGVDLVGGIDHIVSERRERIEC